jgi:O-antigen/teichoic acid export membrane protein
VISAVLGAAKVTPYSIAWRLFLIPPAAMAVVFPFLWPAYAEAIASGDREWVFRTLRLTTLGAATVGGVLSLALVVTGERVIATLAGVENVPPFPVLAWMGAWSFLLSWMNAIACFLNAAGQLRVQAVFGAIGAGANVLLSIAWAREYGLSGVIAATVVTYALVIVGPSLAEARRTYRRLAEG